MAPNADEVLPLLRVHRRRLGPPVVQVSPGAERHHPPVVDLRFLLQQPGALGRSFSARPQALLGAARVSRRRILRLILKVVINPSKGNGPGTGLGLPAGS